MRLVEGRVQVGVRYERHAICELDLCPRFRSRRDRRARLDVPEERGRDRRDHDRPCECRAHRRAEVGHRVLNTADLRALVVRNGRDGHTAELRCERADAEPDQQHGHEDDLRPGVRVEPREQNHRAGKE